MTRSEYTIFFTAYLILFEVLTVKIEVSSRRHVISVVKNLALGNV